MESFVKDSKARIKPIRKVRRPRLTSQCTTYKIPKKKGRNNKEVKILTRSKKMWDKFVHK